MSPSDETRERHGATVRQLLRYVRMNLDGDLSLEALAARAFLAPHHFHRIFRRMTGRGVAGHVRGMRLVRAALDLRLTDRRIIEIAFDAGYENHESFSRAFRREFGMAPREYRASRAAGPVEGGGMKDQDVVVGLVKIPVTDFARAAAFYRETLGLEEEFAVEAYGWGQYRAGGVPLCLYVAGMGGGDGEPGGDTGIHLAVNDAKALYETLAGRGADIPAGLEEADDGGIFFTVRDPDSNTIKVVQRQQ